MKFEKALREALESSSTTKKVITYQSKKKKEWNKKKPKANTGVTGVSSEDTGIPGDFEKMAKVK